MKAKILLACCLLGLTLISCSKDDDEVTVTSAKEVTLKHDGTAQITLSSGTATYESENKFVAKVDENGMITGNHLGETYIKVNGKDAVKVTVKAVYTNYTEPILTFGLTASEIKSKESGTYYRTSSDKTIVYYNGTGKESYHAYTLDSNGKSDCSAMLVKTSYLSSLTDFLIERYAPAKFDSDNYLAYYVNGLTSETATMAVCESVYSTSLTIVLYMPLSSSRSTRAAEIQDMKKKYIQAFQEMGI